MTDPAIIQLAEKLEEFATSLDDRGKMLGFEPPPNQGDGILRQAAALLRGMAGREEPVAWLRDAHDGVGDVCLVPAAKGDPGSFPVYRRAALLPEPSAPPSNQTEDV